MLLAGEGLISVERVSWADDAETAVVYLALLGIFLPILAIFLNRRPTVLLAAALTFIALTVLLPLAAMIALHSDDAQPQIRLDDKGFYRADCKAPLVEDPGPRDDRGSLDILSPSEACREAGQDEVTMAKSLLLGAVTLCSAAGVLLVWGRLRSSPPRDALTSRKERAFAIRR